MTFALRFSTFFFSRSSIRAICSTKCCIFFSSLDNKWLSAAADDDAEAVGEESSPKEKLEICLEIDVGDEKFDNETSDSSAADSFFGLTSAGADGGGGGSSASVTAEADAEVDVDRRRRVKSADATGLSFFLPNFRKFSDLSFNFTLKPTDFLTNLLNFFIFFGSETETDRFLTEIRRLGAELEAELAEATESNADFLFLIELYLSTGHSPLPHILQAHSIA